MAIVFDRSNLNRVVDRTDVLEIIPNQWGLINDMGIFTDRYSSQKRIEIVREFDQQSIAVDRNWDERNSTVGPLTRDSLLLKIPHFPMDDAITPNDIDGIIAVDNVSDAINLETVAGIRMRKMERLRKTHALTLEAARAQLITTGTVYAPTGTLRAGAVATTNYYTEFGVTRTELPITLVGATDPRTQFENVLAGIQDGYQSGQIMTGYMVLCSPSFFSALWTNPFVTDAVKYFQQSQSLSILTGRPQAAGLDARYRSLTLWGLTFVEYRGGYRIGGQAGTFVPYIPAGDAYAFPMGTDDLFETYYAPANRFGSVNRTAQGSYWFEYLNEKDDIIEIMTEQNFLNALLHPQAVVRLYLA